jgi:hypothetical protein
MVDGSPLVLQPANSSRPDSAIVRSGFSVVIFIDCTCHSSYRQNLNDEASSSILVRPASPTVVKLENNIACGRIGSVLLLNQGFAFTFDTVQYILLSLWVGVLSLRVVVPFLLAVCFHSFWQ